MREVIRLVSSENTGSTYYTTKNKKSAKEKLELKKFDKRLRKVVLFVEKKMPSPKK